MVKVMIEENFEGALYALVPLACCTGFEIPVDELAVIHSDCIYSPTEDGVNLAAYGVGWFSGLAGGIIGGPSALKAGKRLHKHKKTVDWYQTKHGKKMKKPK